MTRTKKRGLPEIPPLPEEFLTDAFPGGFTIGDEANALTAFAFRNGPIEDLHAGKSSPLTADPSLSRITQAEMKEIMIEASEKLAFLLELRETEPETYKRFVQAYAFVFCREWNR
jgi:hypothetical protein